MPHEVIVAYRPGVSGLERSALRLGAGLQRIETLRLPRTEVVRVSRASTVEETVVELERDPRVRYAEPNYIATAGATTPNDHSFGQLWGLNNTGQPVNGRPGTPDADIDAPEAWELETGDDSVLVAVVDTGIAFDHPDLAGNIWTNPGEIAGNNVDDDSNGVVDDVHGADFIDNDGDPADFHGHGSHVAGTIGAVGNNGIGISGVAWNVSIMAVRVLDTTAFGTWAQVADGFDYAGDQGVDIVNASLGGPANAETGQVLKDAIQAHPNTLYVVIAHNGGADAIGDNNDKKPNFPCNVDTSNVLCIAATNSDDELAEFSNYGPTQVDMAAPGVDVLSTVPLWDEPLVTFGFEGTGAGSPEGWATGGTSRWAIDDRSSTGSFSITDSRRRDYSNNADTWLKSPSLDLTGEKGCRLLYDIRLRTRNRRDKLLIETSRNGSAWARSAFWYGHTKGAGFHGFSSFIDRLDGDDTAWVRFRLVTNGSKVDDGVHLDDVGIQCLGTPDVGSYEYYNGTSQAAPHVSGAAAVLLSSNPNASVAELKAALMNSGDPLPALSGKTVSGRRLNLNNALGSISPDS